MSIYHDLVPVPQGVSLKYSGNYRYVYHIYAHYKTKNGTWTHRDRSIGRLNEEDPTTMYPNDYYFDLFSTQVENERLTSFQKNEEAIWESFRILGMFGILTNREDLTWQEALTIYRQQDRIEKNYDSMKNNLDFSRLRTHTDANTQGKFFLGFLAQILHADLINHLGQATEKPVSTVQMLLKELRKIRKVTYRDGQKKLLAPLTKKQKDILTLFGLDLETFTASLFSK